VRAAGPLGTVIESDGHALTPGRAYQLPGYQFGTGTSALIVLNRVAFFDAEHRKLHDFGQRALLRWAARQNLGQDPELIRDVAARRSATVEHLRRQHQHVVRLRAEPEWRLAVGLGNNANAHEIGMSLHGSYGWPVIPGSSLKGLAAAWAVASGADPARIRQVLGTPRHDAPAPETSDPGTRQHTAEVPRAARGTVCFLDAVPAGTPVEVVVDVLTPHVKPYYESTASGPADRAVPPAEYHNPVPVNFLTVSGTFGIDLYGRNGDDVELAAQWLTEAGQELGAGAKTAAGYGYLNLARVPPGDDPE
jgi:CRISPR type III-B/RAMP module RAMP protein Cmr6